MTDEFKIQLKVADKYYPLTCKRGKEEELIRKAARNINDKILKWSSTYPEAKLSIKDLLVMAALEISLDSVTAQRNEDVIPLFDKIELLNEELKEYLTKD